MEKYTQKKLRNQLLQTLIGKHVSDKSFERIKECNTFLFMVADKTMEKKKLRNQLLQTLIGKHVSDKSFERIKECNTFLFMVADKTMEKTKLHRSNNCDNRFCPICAWKKSRKNALKISVLMQYLREEERK